MGIVAQTTTETDAPPPRADDAALVAAVRKAIRRHAITARRCHALAASWDGAPHEAWLAQLGADEAALFGATLALHERHGGAIPDALALELGDYARAVWARLTPPTRWRPHPDGSGRLIFSPTPAPAAGQAARRRDAPTVPAAAAATGGR